MSVGAAISITSPDQEALIAAAAAYANREGETCFAIAVVRTLSVDGETDGQRQNREYNLSLLSARGLLPLVQEGDDVAEALASAARHVGVRTLFIGYERPKPFRRSLVERLLRLAPAFDIVVVAPRTVVRRDARPAPLMRS
jgi:K+-sensing histidine kinase KdpD